MAPNFEENIKSVYNERKPFKCEICDAYFANMADLKKHAKSVYEAKKKFKCPICVSTLTQKGSLNRHIATVHDGKKRRSEAVPKDSHNSFNDKVIQDLLAKQVLLPSGDVPPKPQVSLPLNTKRSSSNYKRKMKDFNIIAQLDKRSKCEGTTLIQEEKEIVKNDDESISQESFLDYFNLARKGTENQIVGKTTRKFFRHRTVSQKIIANRGMIGMKSIVEKNGAMVLLPLIELRPIVVYYFYENTDYR